MEKCVKYFSAHIPCTDFGVFEVYIGEVLFAYHLSRERTVSLFRGVGGVVELELELTRVSVFGLDTMAAATGVATVVAM
jgi:hypothetical protein